MLEERIILDKDKLNELGVIAIESLNYTLPVWITYWDRTFYRKIIGVVSYVDFIERQLTLEMLNKDLIYIDIVDIKDIKDIERVWHEHYS